MDEMVFLVVTPLFAGFLTFCITSTLFWLVFKVMPGILYLDEYRMKQIEPIKRQIFRNYVMRLTFGIYFVVQLAALIAVLS